MKSLRRIRFLGAEASMRFVRKHEPKAAIVHHGHQSYSVRIPSKPFPLKCEHCGQTRMVEDDGIGVGDRVGSEDLAWASACYKIMLRQGRHAEMSYRHRASYGVEERFRVPRRRARTRARAAALR